MAFPEKMKALRIEKGITQQRLANDLDLTIRTIGKYETGQALPSADILLRISKYFGISIDRLLTNEEEYIVEAKERGGTRSAREVKELIAEFSGMFAGGKLSNDDMDAAVKAILDAYWIAKEESKKKYTPKRYRASPEKKKVK